MTSSAPLPKQQISLYEESLLLLADLTSVEALRLGPTVERPRQLTLVFGMHHTAAISVEMLEVIQVATPLRVGACLQFTSNVHEALCCR